MTACDKFSVNECSCQMLHVWSYVTILSISKRVSVFIAICDTFTTPVKVGFGSVEVTVMYIFSTCEYDVDCVWTHEQILVCRCVCVRERLHVSSAIVCPSVTRCFQLANRKLQVVVERQRSEHAVDSCTTTADVVC